MTIDNIIGQLPDVVIEESSVIELKGWILSGLRLLPSTGTYIQKIDHFEIINGKVVLPKEIKIINSVLWQHTDFSPNDSTILNCSEEPYEVRTQICKPLIYFSIFLDSQICKNNYKLLKYIGKHHSLICSNCPNLASQCNDTFIVNKENVMYTSFDDGFVCINYDTLECDDKGNLIIPDNEITIQYLINYVMFKSYEKRMLSDNKLVSIYDRYKQEKDIWYRKAKGNIHLSSADVNSLRAMTEQSFFKLLKVSNTNVTTR